MRRVDDPHDHVAPFDEANGLTVDHILTAMAGQYCGRPLQHYPELFLAIQQFAHRNTRLHVAKPNGFCRQFQGTASDDFFKFTMQKMFYASVSELQQQLDAWLEAYNSRRAQQGHRYGWPDAAKGLHRRRQRQTGGARTTGIIEQTPRRRGA